MSFKTFNVLLVKLLRISNLFLSKLISPEAATLSPTASETKLDKLTSPSLTSDTEFQRTSILGVLAIIGSLIFVGIEIRQNSLEIRGSTQQSISEQVAKLYLHIAGDERLSKLVSGMMDNDELRNELNAADQLSLDLTILTGLRRIENIYLQQLDGILSEKAFERIGLEFYRAQYARQSWEKYKTNFDSDFIDFFEELRDNK